MKYRDFLHNQVYIDSRVRDLSVCNQRFHHTNLRNMDSYNVYSIYHRVYLVDSLRYIGKHQQVPLLQ